MRVRGEEVPVDPAYLAAAFPQASERLVVFVHGLGEHEGHWEHRSYEVGGTYGSRLQAMAGWTPVYLRVNTGLAVAENGVALTALLQRLVDAWPTPVRRISLVGHSMGGLIIRAACAVAVSAFNDKFVADMKNIVRRVVPVDVVDCEAFRAAVYCLFEAFAKG